MPEVAAAADEARAIFEQLGAASWLERLAEARAAASGQAPAAERSLDEVAPAP
jgi:hypothetical protein